MVFFFLWETILMKFVILFYIWSLNLQHRLFTILNFNALETTTDNAKTNSMSLCFLNSYRESCQEQLPALEGAGVLWVIFIWFIINCNLVQIWLEGGGVERRCIGDQGTLSQNSSPPCYVMGILKHILNSLGAELPILHIATAPSNFGIIVSF